MAKTKVYFWLKIDKKFFDNIFIKRLTYFKDYSLDAAIDLLYTYWVNEAEGMILKGLSNVPGFTLFQFEQKLNKGGDG